MWWKNWWTFPFPKRCHITDLTGSHRPQRHLQLTELSVHVWGETHLKECLWGKDEEKHSTHETAVLTPNCNLLTSMLEALGSPFHSHSIWGGEGGLLLSHWFTSLCPRICLGSQLPPCLTRLVRLFWVFRYQQQNWQANTLLLSLQAPRTSISRPEPHVL